MPINTRPYGAAAAMLGMPWAAPETWQYQPTTTAHDPFPPITLDFSVLSVSVSGAIAASTADMFVPDITADGDVYINAVPATATAAAQIEWVAAQKGVIVTAAVADVVADALAAVISALGPSVEVEGAVAEAIADAIPVPDMLNNNPSIQPPVAEAVADILVPIVPHNLYIPIATATADVRAADVVTVEVEAPLGSGGSPAGLNFGVCTIDFAIDGAVLDAQPFSIQREGPQHDIRTSPRGYALTSTRKGRMWRFQWGETLVDTATIAELRARVGAALLHNWTWTDPDGTAFDIDGSLTEIEFRWSQETPGFYEPLTFRVLEREA